MTKKEYSATGNIRMMVDEKFDLNRRLFLIETELSKIVQHQKYGTTRVPKEILYYPYREVIECPVDEIDAGKNIRLDDEVSDEEIKNLGDDIRQKGLMHPIVTTIEKTGEDVIKTLKGGEIDWEKSKLANRFLRVVAGHQRLKALKLKRIPMALCRIYYFEDFDSELEFAFSENERRKKTSILSLAAFVNRLHTVKKLSNSEISKKLKINETKIRRLIKIDAKWSEKLKNKVAENQEKLTVKFIEYMSSRNPDEKKLLSMIERELHRNSKIDATLESEDQTSSESHPTPDKPTRPKMLKFKMPQINAALYAKKITIDQLLGAVEVLSALGVEAAFPKEFLSVCTGAGKDNVPENQPRN